MTPDDLANLRDAKTMMTWTSKKASALSAEAKEAVWRSWMIPASDGPSLAAVVRGKRGGRWWGALIRAARFRFVALVGLGGRVGFTREVRSVVGPSALSLSLSTLYVGFMAWWSGKESRQMIVE